jgi:hypothetical protein
MCRAQWAQNMRPEPVEGRHSPSTSSGHIATSSHNRQLRARSVIGRAYLSHPACSRTWRWCWSARPPQPRRDLGRSYRRRDPGSAQQRPAASHRDHHRGRAAPGRRGRLPAERLRLASPIYGSP